MPPIANTHMMKSKIETRVESEKRHPIKVQTRDIIKMKRIKRDSKIRKDDRKALFQTKRRWYILLTLVLFDRKTNSLLLVFKLSETTTFYIVFQESGNSESYGTSYFVNGGVDTSSTRSLEIILFVLILLFFYQT